MNIRSSSLALGTAAALSLGLVACSSDNEAPTTDASDTTDTQAVDEDEAAGVIGDTITDDCTGYMDCQVEVTVTEITVGEQCRYGTNDYGGEGEEDFGKLDDGEQYLQVWAEFAVTSDDRDDWSMMQDPQIIDADGFTQSTGMSVDCRNSDEGHENWSNPVDAGSKSRMYGSFVIPDDAEHMVLQDRTFVLPDAEESTDEMSGPAPTAGAQQDAPAPASERETVVDTPFEQDTTDGEETIPTGTSGETDSNPLFDDLDDIAPDRHSGPGEFEPAA
ncbi:hypothetical protein ACT3SZ_04690 [Corynebacterium sp. AOP40-9SA-29]|uniref:hypothetical protein n=1 Tax=Corynebacterium sp. AOP40-9SA-29 TaxID=3457677 RepID=UPI0040349D0B